MNKEAKITICLLVIFFIGFIIHQIDSQRRDLINIMDSHEMEMKEVLQQYQDINMHLDSLLNIIDNLPLGSPLDTLQVSSEYGWRRSPLRTGWQMHGGTDYLAAWQDTVYATGIGVVKRARWNAGYGRCIIIDHTWGYQSTYAHLYRMFVKKGDSIKKGQAIGRAGNSGAVTGPHLHYEVRRNGKSTDPLWYINLNKK